MENNKHYIYTLDVKNAAVGGVDVGITVDMFASKSVAAAVGLKLGEVASAIINSEEVEHNVTE